MVAFDTLQNLQRDLIRKAVNGSVFVAPHTAASLDEATLFNATTGALAALPTGYEDVGYMTDAGVAFATAITESPVTSWQSVSPTRSDRTAETTTAKINAQETKLLTIGLYTGADTAAVTPDSGSGVVRIDKPTIPANRNYRFAAFFVDQVDAGEIVVVRYLPNAKVTDVDNQSMDKGDEVLWPITVTANVDDAEGTAESFIFGGVGWKAILADMGFTP